MGPQLSVMCRAEVTAEKAGLVVIPSEARDLHLCAPQDKSGFLGQTPPGMTVLDFFRSL
jgi:hypothetical protein